MEKRRNFSSFPQYFQYISNFKSQIHIYLLNVVNRIIYFLNPANLDMLRYGYLEVFRESLEIRDNESRLYIVCSF